jgi:hypothetical protein
MLGSSATSPADTVVQGNLFVKGGITAASSVAPNVTITGNLAVGGISTLTGPVSAGSTLAVAGSSTLTGPVSAGSTLAVAGTINVAGAGVIGTPSTTTGLTVNGNIAQNNIAAANTFNAQSNAFSGSVSIGGGTGPGAGLVTVNGGLNIAAGNFIGAFINNTNPPTPNNGASGSMRIGAYLFQWGLSNAGPTPQSVAYGIAHASGTTPVVICQPTLGSSTEFCRVTVSSATGFQIASSTSAGTGGDCAVYWLSIGAAP